MDSQLVTSQVRSEEERLECSLNYDIAGGLMPQSCRCDSGTHFNVTVKELGQKQYATISKTELAKLSVENIENKCQELAQFLAQQQQKTGFIPLSPLQFGHIKHCNKCIVDKDLLAKPVLLYNCVKKHKCPNFLGARIQVNFDINLDLVDKLCMDYWDWQLPLFLRFGFPMDFQGDLSRLRNEGYCHSSAKQHPADVLTYLSDEIQHGAIHGPFKVEPFGELTHVSPFITRHKPDSNKRRVIVDLSWPQNASVNDFTSSREYLGTAFKLAYPSVDTFVDRLRELGRGCHMMKVDLSRAFRQLKVDPGDYPLLCLQWDDNYFIDTAYAFGHKTGSMGCSRLSDLIRHVHSKQGFYLMSYVDDLLLAELPSKSMHSYTTLLKLLENLNIPVSQAKLCPPSTTVTCLGILVDSLKGTVSVPSEKLEEIIQKCKHFLTLKTFTKNQLQSLLGSLMYLHKVVKPARYFVNRLLQALRDMSSRFQNMTVEVQKDVQWFLTFASQFNGTCSYFHLPMSDNMLIELDACLTGLGGRCNDEVYQFALSSVCIPTTFSIVQLEMLNVVGIHTLLRAN